MTPLESTFAATAAEVDRAKTADPLAPVVILLPSALLCTSFRRYLLESGRALANLRSETPRACLTRLGQFAANRSGRPFVNRSDAHALLAAVLDNTSLQAFAPAREFPSYTAYIARTIDDLRRNMDPEMIATALADMGRSGAELAMIAGNFLKELGERADYASCLRGLTADTSRCAIIAFPHALDGCGTLELEAIARMGDLIQMDWVHQNQKPEKEIIAAPVRQQEIAELFRSILASGTPLDRSVVVAPSDYLEALADGAGRLGIPVRFAPEGAGGDTPNGLRVFSALLSVAANDCPYPRLKEVLQLKNQYGQLRELAGLGISGGFRPLMGALKGKNEEHEGESRSKLLAQLQALSDIADSRTNPHATGRALLEFVPNGVGRNILDSLLTDLERAQPTLGFLEWEREVAYSIAHVRAARPGQEGALLITSSLLPGLFDAVYMPGLIEGSYPRTTREDPILPDEDRLALNKTLGVRLETRQDQARALGRDFRRTVDSARNTWVGLFPEADATENKSLNPTYLLVDIVSDIEKRPVTHLDYNKHLMQARRPAFRLAPDDDSIPVSELELQIATLHSDGSAKDLERRIAHSLTTSPMAARHLERERARWSDRYSTDNGLVPPALLDGCDSEVSSPSRIQNFLTCPRKWLLTSHLGLKPFSEPAEQYSLDPMTLGAIVHRVLEEHLRGGMPTTIEALRATAERRIREWALYLGGLNELYVNLELERTSKFLKNFSEYQAASGAGKTLALEYKFGLPDSASEAEDPLPFETPAGTLLLRGVIDRVDQDGTAVRVIDYKTGNPKIMKKWHRDQVHPAAALQPVIYAAAVEHYLKRTVSRVGFLSLKGDQPEELLRDLDGPLREKTADALAFVLGAMRSGLAIPTADGCQYCEGQPVCGKMIGYSIQRRWVDGGLSGEQARLMQQYHAFSDYSGENE